MVNKLYQVFSTAYCICAWPQPSRSDIESITIAQVFDRKMVRLNAPWTVASCVVAPLADCCSIVRQALAFGAAVNTQGSDTIAALQEYMQALQQLMHTFDKSGDTAALATLRDFLSELVRMCASSACMAVHHCLLCCLRLCGRSTALPGSGLDPD